MAKFMRYFRKVNIIFKVNLNGLWDKIFGLVALCKLFLKGCQFGYDYIRSRA